MKHPRYRLLLFIMCVFAAIQFYDAAMWIWVKIVIQNQGVFVVEPMPIVVCAMIGTSIGCFLAWKILQGIDAEVEAAIDGFADYIAKRLTKSLDKMEEGAGNE